MLSWKGKAYALPSAAPVYALFYHKGRFREAGFDDTVGPKTIAELDEYAEKLTELGPGGEIERLGYHSYGRWNIGQIIAAFGGKYYDEENQKVTADDPNTLKAIEWILSYPRKYGVDEMSKFMTGAGKSAAAAMIPTKPEYMGLVAMWQSGSWEWWYAYTVNPKAGMQIGSVPFPQVPRQPMTSAAYAGAWMLPKGSKHPAEAMKWVKFAIHSPANLKEGGWHYMGYAPIASKIVWDSAENRFSNPGWQVFDNILKNARIVTEPVMLTWPKYRDDFWAAFEYVLHGKKTAKQALSELGAEIQKAEDRARAR
jgi:ABC-type glycerol-3-phosphate transport system substrate-binding protein